MKLGQWMRSSLPARAGLAVILIAILALASSLSAGLIAWFSEDDASAINTAGSLRMKTYQTSWAMEARVAPERINALGDELERRLYSNELTRVLEGNQDAKLNQAYESLKSRWQSELKPALHTGNYSSFLSRADGFVMQLDQFVLQLQHHSERKQIWQQGIQGTALFITMIILVIGMYELQNSVIAPLEELGSVAERFRSGDLSARVSYRSEDELGQMALSFNSMADAIEESHRTLESRVAQKTESLARANDTLELLYNSSRNLATSQASAEQLDQLIDRFQTLLPGLRLTLCLSNNPEKPAEPRLALHGSESREICSRNDCAGCERLHQHNLESFPVSNQGNQLGELRAHFTDGRPAAGWEAGMIQALADLVGTALSLERQREQDHRLLLLDERTIIARELHDSLAQALTYMKLQVTRLHTLIQRGESAEKLLSVSDELREGLNNAYRQLRELLTTFRLKIHDGGLDQALDDTVREFSERGGFQVLLQSEPLAVNLSASEQIHLLQIAREALSNCARHAHAQQVNVHLLQHGEQIELHIEDDGCGISSDFDTRQHHGLGIMEERTRSLHGNIRIEPRSPRGTRVVLQFRPEFLVSHAGENIS
ncbi:MAG: histidine kinase [Moraxellaceae bacterium]|nr:histidine kinase [Moraxellaceae bacterium]